MERQAVIPLPTVSTIYEIPLILEETGLGVDNLKFLDFCSRVDGPSGHVVVFAFTTKDFVGDLIAGDDASDAAFFPLAELPTVAFLCHQELINIYLQNFKKIL